MPLLKDRLQQNKNDRKEIEYKIEHEAIKPTLDEMGVVDKIVEVISDRFKKELSQQGFSDEIREAITNSIDGEIRTAMIGSYETEQRIRKTAISMILGLGPLDDVLYREDITEIIVERYDKICIEKDGKVLSTKLQFNDENQLVNTINRIVQPVGRQVNQMNPIVDARLEDGSRVHAVIPPVAPDGAMLTIRKFKKKAYTADDYLNWGSLNEDMLYFLECCVRGRVSILVSGGTGSGKTTLLNMLSNFVPGNELIITVEDDCELKLNQPNVRRLEAKSIKTEGSMKVDIQTLIKACLRMRPDRIIVGEIRDGSVVDMITAMGTGHDGSMSTVHANSPANLINARLPILYSMYESGNFTQEAINLQVAEAVNIVVQVSRMVGGSRKITNITEICGVDEKGKIKMRDIFLYDTQKEEFVATQYVPNRTLKLMEKHGVTCDMSVFGKGGDKS